ncbi:hypothetical protein FMEAI12_6730020 [Parafrankia sp. Ea1.12]|nr:hypothetical protein FMEAI12_6730020 [Parafrankia sp. Ea1.12]
MTANWTSSGAGLPGGREVGRVRAAHAGVTDRPVSDQRAKRVQSSSSGRDGPDAPRENTVTATA